VIGIDAQRCYIYCSFLLKFLQTSNPPKQKFVIEGCFPHLNTRKKQQIMSMQIKRYISPCKGEREMVYATLDWLEKRSKDRKNKKKKKPDLSWAHDFKKNHLKLWRRLFTILMAFYTLSPDEDNSRIVLNDLVDKCFNPPDIEPQNTLSPISVLEYIVYKYCKENNPWFLELLEVNLTAYAIETFTLIERQKYVLEAFTQGQN